MGLVLSSFYLFSRFARFLRIGKEVSNGAALSCAIARKALFYAGFKVFYPLLISINFS